MPYDAKLAVTCSNKDKGPKVMAVCDTGCIGCGICAKQCEFGAVTVENNIAHIDQSKCTGCGKCAEKCPKKIIINEFVVISSIITMKLLKFILLIIIKQVSKEVDRYARG